VYPPYEVPTGYLPIYDTSMVFTSTSVTRILRHFPVCVKTVFMEATHELNTYGKYNSEGGHFLPCFRKFKSRNELKAGLPAVLHGSEPGSIAKRK